MAAPARFPSGATNVGADDVLGMLIHQDPTRANTYFNDFHQFTAADWTITKVGTGTTALGDVDHGALVITNTAGATDSVFLQKVGSPILFEAGKQTWFKARFKILDANLSTAVIGLQITDTTPLAVSNGVFFVKASGALTMDFLVEASSVATTQSAAVTLVSDTYMTVGFYYDGKSEVTAWADIAGNNSTNRPRGGLQKVATVAVTNLPTAQVLTPSFGVGNGQAVANVMTVDYLFASKERFF